MRFKRVVDKNGGKITYIASDFGFSYAVNVSGAESSHQLGWYIVTGGKPETWHRKADYMEETLAEISLTDPSLAERIFYAINDCVGCGTAGGSSCLVGIPYKYNGKTKTACHGRAQFRMCPGDFHDVTEFIRHINILAEKKTANGEHPSDKILLRAAPPA